MKGIILHGGAGTRLRPITHTGPKQLIPIANKPMSQYALEYLVEAGIKDIAIILGDIYPDKVKEYYGDGSKFGCTIDYIEQGIPLGIAHAVSLTEKFVDGDRLAVVLGDNLIGGNIDNFVKKFEASDFDSLILLAHTSHPHDFGIARLSDQGEIVELIEKPKVPPSDLAVTGIYFFTDTIYDHIKGLKPSWRNEYEITEAIQSLINSGGKVGCEIIDAWWKDTGTVEDVLMANMLVLNKIDTNVDRKNIKGKVIIGKQTGISDDSVIRGPAIIGDRCEIEGSFIGPYTSIGDNCILKNASIENSIVMKGSRVESDNRIADSIIGEGSSILNKNSMKPDGSRMVIGENSKIYI